MDDDMENQFYVLRKGRDWRFIDLEKYSSDVEELKLERNDESFLHEFVGMWDHNNLNQRMKGLLDKMVILSMQTTDLFDYIRQTCNFRDSSSLLNNIITHKIFDQDDEADERNCKIIHEIFILKKNIKAVARKFDADLLDVSRFWSKYRQNLRMININNKRFLNKTRKLDSNKLGLIQNYWNTNKYDNFTANDVRLHLQNEIGDGWSISLSSVTRCLKNSIGLSYKKVNKIHPKILKWENKRKMLEAALLQQKLNEEKVTVIYVDEFKFSWHSSAHYGWSLKGQSGYRGVTPGKFQATFMVAFSKTKIQGIIATTHTFNSNIFRYFLHQLSSTLSEDYALIWDNSKIHTAKIVQDFANRTQTYDHYNTCLLTICQCLRKTHIDYQEQGKKNWKRRKRNFFVHFQENSRQDWEYSAWRMISC